jgi:hypothetical protein
LYETSRQKIIDALNNAKDYTKCLIELMSFLVGVQYNTVVPSFSCNQLTTITTDQVASYLNKKLYGMPLSGTKDCPHLIRSSSLAFHKQAISQFMPLCIMSWDDINL